MSKFDKICSEVFFRTIVPEAINNFSLASTQAFVELSQPSKYQVNQNLINLNVSEVVPIEVQVEDLREAYVTSIKAKLKRRLTLLPQSCSDERKKYKEVIFNTKSKLKQMPIEIRLLKKKKFGKKYHYL